MIQYEAAVIILFTVLLLIQSVTVNPFSTLAFSSRKFDSRPHLHQQGPTSTTRIHSDMNSHARHVTEIGKGPIFITIGPQGAGKTTFISNLSADVSADADTATTPHAVDICIDNQEGVYLPIPIDLFLVNSIENKTLATKHNALIQYSIHNNTIQERIYDAANDEMRWITQRLCNQITQQEFINKIMTMDTNNATQATWKNVLQRDGDADVDGESPDWKTYLLKIVDDNVLKEHDIHVDHVDLFVVESIFKQTPKNLPFASTNGGADAFAKTNIDWPSHITNRPKSGLLAVSSKLKFLAMDEIHQSTSLAWGNTNAVSVLQYHEHYSALQCSIMQYSTSYMSADHQLPHPQLYFTVITNIHWILLNRNQEIMLQPWKSHKKVVDPSISFLMQISMNWILNVLHTRIILPFTYHVSESKH
jgi:hypothetical protein